jgi:hypothetical protein
VVVVVVVVESWLSWNTHGTMGFDLAPTTAMHIKVACSTTLDQRVWLVVHSSSPSLNDVDGDHPHDHDQHMIALRTRDIDQLPPTPTIRERELEDSENAFTDQTLTSEFVVDASTTSGSVSTLPNSIISGSGVGDVASSSVEQHLKLKGVSSTTSSKKRVWHCSFEHARNSMLDYHFVLTDLAYSPTSVSMLPDDAMLPAKQYIVCRSCWYSSANSITSISNVHVRVCVI